MRHNIVIPVTEILNRNTENIKQTLPNKEILSHIYLVKRTTRKVYQCKK